MDLAQTPEVMEALTARRIVILLAVRAGTVTLQGIAHALGTSAQAIQAHLRVLERLGLLEDDRGAARAGERYNARRLALGCERLVLTLDAGANSRPAERTVDLAASPEWLDVLSARRIRVMLAIGAGAFSVRELARALDLSEQAVHGHLRAIEPLGLIADWRRPERRSHSRRGLQLACRRLVLRLDLERGD